MLLSLHFERLYCLRQRRYLSLKVSYLLLLLTAGEAADSRDHTSVKNTATGAADPDQLTFLREQPPGEHSTSPSLYRPNGPAEVLEARNS